MAEITLEQIHKDIIGLKEEMKHLKVLIEEDFELKDDAVKEIEESRKKNFKELISHEAMKKEFA